MRHFLFTLVIVGFYLQTFAQGGHGFPFGQVTYRELNIETYEKDTSATALVLDEFGEAYFDNSNDNNLLFEYHTKIKILKKAGVSCGTFEIPLRKSEGREEIIRELKASTFDDASGSMKELKLDLKKVYTENYNKYYNIKKFALPDVQVGSVIEVYYQLESPFFFYNFRPWEFQSDIPKVNSEFWCLIPAKYVYNISLKGYLTLAKNESELVKECFSPGGGYRADCSRLKFGMKDIPAFKEEEYMTAKSNFLSSINFELSEFHYYDGRRDKITKEWKDVDQELRLDSKFGVQIKRGKDIMDHHIDLLIGNESDPLIKARSIYDFIKGHYLWNDTYGKYSELGIKKAFDKKTGNVGDINLSLIAALKYAGLNVEPLLLSTRENGAVTPLYPVLTEFDYVIAKLNVNDKVFLLDATDDFYPFGLIPTRCLNGKGRVLGEKESYWYDLKASEKEKTVSVLNLVLDSNGVMRGSLQYSYTGYSAIRKRKKISQAGSHAEYIRAISATLPGLSVKKFQIENQDDYKKPLVVKLDVEMEAGDYTSDNFLFNPFLVEQVKRNPFRSAERLYPVDFGAPLEDVIIFSLEYPSDYEIDGLPSKVGLALPQSGGRYIFDIQNTGNKLTMNNSLLIAKAEFSSQEYHYLKELFNQVVATHQTELVFKKKK
jgi:hypothetical protein